MVDVIMVVIAIIVFIVVLWLKQDNQDQRTYRNKTKRVNDDDLIDGYVLQPTPQIWTRKAVLDQYGKVYSDPSEINVEFTPREGAVLPETKSWEDMGFDLEEPPDSTHASDIGQISKEEMERYLQYLKKMRVIFEDCSMSAEDRISSIENISGYEDIKKKLNDAYDYPQCLFVEPMTEIKGIGYKTARSLFDAGYQSVNDLSKAGINDLTSIDGIGKKTAENLIRQAS